MRAGDDIEPTRASEHLVRGIELRQLSLISQMHLGLALGWRASREACVRPIKGGVEACPGWIHLK
jgi:hypothetical protein